MSARFGAARLIRPRPPADPIADSKNPRSGVIPAALRVRLAYPVDNTCNGLVTRLSRPGLCTDATHDVSARCFLNAFYCELGGTNVLLLDSLSRDVAAPRAL